ncbi:sigma factor-like helix-turn-helix DNA-binding protein [Sphaerisporangium sp. NPDC051017]|uniref:sigma factor-like helix-turn-helix DNA-binding protein n=1 Tax=Sphaerisporangium sp. NPDC051017 TaxID=3154636 RepID=UPI00344A11FE
MAAANDPYDRALVADDLKRDLATLPPRQRAVIVLRYHLDLSESDSATILGCSIGTVKSQSHKALGRLRSLITDVLE